MPNISPDDQQLYPHYLKHCEGSETPFVEESRVVKMRKIDAGLTTQEYIMRLKNMIQVMDGNCMVCMVTNPDVSKEHDHS